MTPMSVPSRVSVSFLKPGVAEGADDMAYFNCIVCGKPADYIADHNFPGVWVCGECRPLGRYGAQNHEPLPSAEHVWSLAERGKRVMRYINEFNESGDMDFHLIKEFEDDVCVIVKAVDALCNSGAATS